MAEISVISSNSPEVAHAGSIRNALRFLSINLVVSLNPIQTGVGGAFGARANFEDL